MLFDITLLSLNGLRVAQQKDVTWMHTTTCPARRADRRRRPRHPPPGLRVVDFSYASLSGQRTFPRRGQECEVLAGKSCDPPFIPPASGGKRISFPRLRGTEGVELHSPARRGTYRSRGAAPPWDRKTLENQDSLKGISTLQSPA
jgi:hypothetical protein